MMEWEWERADQSLQRAIALDPAYTWARDMYAILLAQQGRLDEAIEQLQRARRLDPVTAPLGVTDLGFLYSLKGDLESAAEAWQASLELAPDDFRVHRLLGNHFCRRGDFEEAFREFERAMSVVHDRERLLSDLGYCHALAGNREEAEEYLEQIEASAEQMYVDPVHPALVHLGLGDSDRSLELLQRAYDLHGSLLTEVPTDPRYAPLHSDPRYQEIVRGIGLGSLLPPPKG